MTHFEDNLWESVVDQHGDDLTRGDAPGTQHSRVRPRLLAGGTLGLAGVGAGLVLALSGSTASPAFAITRHDDGSVLVTLNSQENIGQANQKLSAMGINEQITLYTNPNPTASSQPEVCVPGPGAGAPNPPIRLVVNTDNADNTGTTGAVVCVVGPHEYTGPYPGTAGGTGSGNSGTTTGGQSAR